MRAVVLAAIILAASLTGSAGPPAAAGTTRPSCPRNTLVVVEFGMAPSCKVDGLSSLWVRFPDSNHGERDRWRPTCQRMMGRLRWWMPNGRSPAQGEYVCRWVDPSLA